MISLKRGNSYYSVETNKEKNRIYFSMSGDIPSVDAIPDFVPDWHASVAEAQNSFTILGDLSNCGQLPSDVEKVNQETQGWLMQQGCRKVAQLVGDLNVMSQVNDFASKSGMRDILRAFNFGKSAELWLDVQ